MKGFLTVLLMAIIQAASCRNGYHRYYLLDNEEKNIFYPKILLCEQGKNLDDRRKHQEILQNIRPESGPLLPVIIRHERDT
jgi:hypothetical protein